VRNRTRNDYGIRAMGKTRGIALLVMLAIILVAFTTIAISRLSVNSLEQQKRIKATQALVQAREAMMAFAVSSAPVPGTLPCPDGDGDGLSDPLNGTGNCTNQLGLVPFRTLSIPQPLDDTDTSIWYAVADEYSRLIAGATRNSSSTSTLMLNINQSMAFILFSPNYPLLAQVRTSKTPLVATVAQFLEGDNGDVATPNSYTDLRNNTQNDQVMGVPVRAFWTAVEGRVLGEVNEHLDDYFNVCGAAPAVPFGNPNDDGVPTTVEGRVPLGNWASLCPTAAPLPAWLTTHWRQMLYYAYCVAPSCIRLEDALGLNPVFVSAIVIAPGTPFVGQPPRVAGTIVHYFELENADFPDYVFTQIKSTSQPATFNDRIYIVR
jgi:Tfp pilus assembly protein PilX